MSTLKDVAERAGVSPSIISYVLNGKKKVTPETYQRIQQAIEELEYRPNLIARSLKTKQTMVIGIVVTEITSAFFAEIIREVEEVFTKHGYSAMVCNCAWDVKKEESHIRNLVARNVDGILFVGSGQIQDNIQIPSNIPIVGVERKIPNSPYAVVIDNEEGGYIGTKHLLNCGCSNIAFLGFEHAQVVMERFAGYRKALAETNIPIQEEYIHFSELTHASGYEIVTQMLDNGVKPDGIFASTDYIVPGILRAVKDWGLSVPQDIRVLGYDNMPNMVYFTPAVTDVAQPQSEMSHLAAEMMMKLVKGVAIAKPYIVLKPELIIRESC